MLQLVFEGASNRDIGARLKINLHIVESELAKLLAVLGLNTRQDITHQPDSRQRKSRQRTKRIEKQ
jgi:DNA-binding CsgD family transcriptional regulator